MNKTPIQELIEEFELLGEKATSLRDKIYLDGVLSVIDTYKQQEKQFGFCCFEAGTNKGIDLCLEEDDGMPSTKPDFDEFYKQYEQ